MNIPPAKYTISNNINWVPQRVFLFSGHMIDTVNRASPRFPASKADAVASAINNQLQQLQAGTNDLGLTQGSNGGDIIFAETCLQHNMQLQLLQPFFESEFITNSIIPGGQEWLDRYQLIRQQLPSPPLAATEQLGALTVDMNAYEHCNLWLLNSALAYGVEKLIFICLWDGCEINKPGGTAHMVAEVTKRQGQVIHLNPSDLN